MESEAEVQPRPEFEVRKTVFPDDDEKMDQAGPESPTEETNGTNGHEGGEAAHAYAVAEPDPISNDGVPEDPMDVDGEQAQPEVSPPAEPEPEAEGLSAEPEPEVQDMPAEPEPETEDLSAEPEPEVQDMPAEPEPETEDQPAEPETEVEEPPVEAAQPEAEDHPAEPEPAVEDAAPAEPGAEELPAETQPEEEQPVERQAAEADEQPIESPDPETDSPDDAKAEAAVAAEPASAFDALVTGESHDHEQKEEVESGESGADVGDAAAEKPEEEADKNDAHADTDANEVFDVEDDGKVIPAKPKLPADTEYFDALDSEELEWYKEHVQDHDKKLQCTSCFKQVSSEINAHSGVFRHPMLGVVMCKACKNYYDDGEWTKDEEGFDMFCRWCGQGGDIMICDKCPHAFCKKCLQRNLGRKFVSEISSSEEWKCLVCNPKQIYELRALYYALYVNQKDILEKKLKRAEEQAKRRSSVAATPKKTEKTAAEEAGVVVPEIPDMTFSSENFLDDNFAESMKTLAEFQTLMEEEQGRWNEAGKVMNPEIATSITRKLRKFYNATKQSMDVLDRALATAYVSKYPEEAKRIHLGKDDEVIDAETEYGSVKKRQPKPKKKPVLKKKKVVATPAKKKAAATPAKKKILPKKKVVEEKKRAVAVKAPAKKAPAKPAAKKPAPKPKAVAKPGPRTAKKPETNGAKSSYVTPSLMAAMSKKKPAKGSAAPFKGKKRPAPANDSDESDIEILEEVEQSPPPAKKPKIGPKSKTRV